MTNDNTNEDIIDLGAILATVWRGKWLIAVSTLCAMIIGLYYAFLIATPLYRSTAVVILETQQEQVVDLQSVVGGLSTDASAVNSELQVLYSRSLMGKTVERLNLVEDPEFNAALRKPGWYERFKATTKQRLRLVTPPPERDEATLQQRSFDRTVDALLRAITVQNVSQSLVFNISAETQDPDKSRLIADTIAELYILNQLEVKFEATQQATAWLTDRVAELQTELEMAEAKVSEFSAGTDLVSVEALQALERQLKDLRDRVEAATENEAAAKERLAALQAVQDAPRAQQAEVANDSQLSRFLTRLNAAPDDATLQQAFDTRFEQSLARAELEANRATTQLTALENSSVELDAQIETQGQDLIALQQLTRESEASRLLYEYFLGRLKETSAQQGIQQADSRILSNAVTPLEPAKPQKKLVLAIATFFGMFLGTALVLILEASQNSFRTARELENATGYTVMGQLPLIPARKRKDALAYLADKPTSAAAEAVRNLRTSVLLSNMDQPPQVIMSTSSIPGEGKTTVSLSMAQNLTGMGKKVLLIEGDIRRRVFGQYMDSKDKKGLLAVLSGEATVEDAIVHDERVGADILIGEQTNTNAADVFSSDRFKTFIDEMRAVYDVIIIDTPPVLIVPDARIIAGVCDAVLFTVKWDSTSRPQVEEALRMFETVNQKVSGLVLNQISPRGMKRYGYGGKYGAYSAYGAKYYTN